MGNFLVRDASRVVIYDCRAVIRLATALDSYKILVTWRGSRNHQSNLRLDQKSYSIHSVDVGSSIFQKVYTTSEALRRSGYVKEKRQYLPSINFESPPNIV